MVDRNQIAKWIDAIALTLIGGTCLLYFTFVRIFAELHIKFAFLDFPVFVGELLLIVCTLLFVIKWIILKKPLSKGHILFLLYIGFVCFKAFYGYRIWGALAFRHAALFYYPCFAVLCFNFYNKDLIHNRYFPLLGVFLMTVILMKGKYNGFYTLPLIMLAVLFALSISYKWTRWSVLALLLLISPFYDLFFGARTMLLSNIVIYAFLIFAFNFIIKIDKRYKIGALVVFLLVFCLAFAKFTDKYAVSSFTNFEALAEEYNRYTTFIEERREGFVPLEIEVPRIYNVQGEENVWEQEEIAEEVAMVAEESNVKKTAETNVIKQIKQEIKKHQEQKQVEKLSTKKSESTKPPSRYPVAEVARTNIFFRVFIWQDMVDQFWEAKPLIGFDFGKPLRSYRLEMLAWADGEWDRDGWIGAHHSYLHMIYRSGILGLVFIVSFFVLFFNKVKKVLRVRSVKGVLLCATLLFWIVAANFLLILELPYNAVPFWCLFGIMFAYVEQKESLS